MGMVPPPLLRPRNGYLPAVEPAEDAFSLEYRSPVIRLMKSIEREIESYRPRAEYEEMLLAPPDWKKP